MKRSHMAQLWPGQLLIAALIAAIAAVAVGCSGGGDGGGEVTNELAPNQELRLRISADPGTLDPQLASFSEEISVVKQLFRGLFEYNEDLSVTPALALDVPTKENGGISEDGLTYTIDLRQDATWSDGQPVTAQDFVYAFQRLFDPEGGGQGYYTGSYAAIAGAGPALSGEGSPADVGVTALDEYTLQITLAQPMPTLPTLLALWPASPLRQDVIEQHGAAWTEPGNIVTNGPFVLADYAPEDRIVLEANTAYWGDDPTLERMVYRIIPEDSAALAAYENGEIDMTSIAPTDAARFEGDEELIITDELSTSALLYNLNEPPFDDAQVRQAISRAIDRGSYVEGVLDGTGEVALSWLPPGLPGADPSIGSELEYDPEAASALLSEAGYPDGEGFPTMTITIADNPPSRTFAEFLQEQLRQNLNVTVEIEALEPTAMQDRFGTGEFEVTYFTWFADYPDPENWMPQFFRSGAGLNMVIGYENSQVDELLDQASSEFDNAERLALYDQAQEIVIEEDQAVTPVLFSERNYLVKSHVSGITATPLDAELGDWFVENVRILESGAAPPASNPDEE